MRYNTKLTRISDKVIAKMDLPNENQEYGSVVLTIMIIGIILSLIRVIQECNSSRLKNMNKNNQLKFMKDNIHNMSTKVSWWSQLRLKRLIKNKMSPEDYKKYGHKLQQAIVETGTNLTEKEIQTLLEAS